MCANINYRFIKFIKTIILFYSSQRALYRYTILCRYSPFKIYAHSIRYMTPRQKKVHITSSMLFNQAHTAKKRTPFFWRLKKSFPSILAEEQQLHPHKKEGKTFHDQNEELLNYLLMKQEPRVLCYI